MADPDHHYHDHSPSSSSSRLSSRLSSTAVNPASQLTDQSSVRSRGRRQASSIRNGTGYDDNNDDDDNTNDHNDALDKGKDNGSNNNSSKNNNYNNFRNSSRSIAGKNVRNQERMHPIRNRVSGLLTASHPLESPAGSRASSRGAGVSPSREAGAAGGLGQFLGDSLSQSWTSMQGLAASLIAAGEEQIGAVGRSQAKNWSSSPKFNRWGWDRSASDKDAADKALGVWGPAPPAPPRPGIHDVAVGSSSERDAALKAARTASVLESHQGVNGGLDVTGNYKRRTSDEIAPASAPPPPEEYLVYIHTVQPSDTYAGLVLRYKCRGDAFKKANGLWSNDSIQMRRWLTFPVDACELRGRPCGVPSKSRPPGMESSSATPTMPPSQQLNGIEAVLDDPLRPDTPSESIMSEVDKDRPWTHVRWVRIDSFPEPVEIGRVSRQAMSYFPPRRKRSVTTTSSISASTPRQSLDIGHPSSSPAGRSSSRRHSSLTSHSRILGSPSSSRAQPAKGDAGSAKPAWMRRPGGIGSMEQNVRTPGPEKDSLNKWMEKHMPSLNIDELPSMSIMGSETARLGFGHNSAGIVESPFGQGQNAAPDNSQGIGFDKAAMAVENWLRGALSRHPSSPLMASIRGRSASQDEGVGDLIELSHTAGDPEDQLLSSSRLRDRSPADTSQRDALKSEGFRSRKTDRNPF